MAGLVACLSYSLEKVRSSVTDNSDLLGVLEVEGVPYYWRVGLATVVGLTSWAAVIVLARRNPQKLWKLARLGLFPILFLCVLSSWVWP